MNENNKITIQVPVVSDLVSQGKRFEYLFWVGSAGAYDHRYQKVTRAFVKLLHYFKVNYAVLGTEEIDTGDAARRSGNEMLFQMQSFMIMEMFRTYGISKIITCCPHDYNLFKNEYPELGMNLEVWHHTQFLAKLLDGKKLLFNNSDLSDKKIVFHDPCYLGRGNGEYEAPRFILSKIPSKKIELPRSRSRSLCCGAGGGQVFKESEPGNKEVYAERTEEIIDSGADIVATACPFCMIMLTDGIKYKEKEKVVKNYDIAELLEMAMGL